MLSTEQALNKYFSYCWVIGNFFQIDLIGRPWTLGSDTPGFKSYVLNLLAVWSGEVSWAHWVPVSSKGDKNTSILLLWGYSMCKVTPTGPQPLSEFIFWGYFFFLTLVTRLQHLQYGSRIGRSVCASYPYFSPPPHLLLLFLSKEPKLEPFQTNFWRKNKKYSFHSLFLASVPWALPGKNKISHSSCQLEDLWGFCSWSLRTI